MTPAQVQAHYAKTTQQLAISVSNGQATLTWPLGLLLETPDLNGPWTTNLTATPPSFQVPATGPMKLCRIQF